MQATGIPPLHVFMHEISKQNAKQAAHNEEQTAHNLAMLETVRGIRPTESEPQNPILSTIVHMLEDLKRGVRPEEARDIVPLIPQALPETAVALNRRPPQLYLYPDGVFRKVPMGYKFNWRCPLKQVFDLYYEGDKSSDVIPYRYLDSIDVGVVNKPFLSMAKILVKEINRFLPDNYSTLTYTEKNLLFGQGFSRMATAFITDNPDHAKMTNEKHSIFTIYNKHYLPCQKKRKRK